LFALPGVARVFLAATRHSHQDDEISWQALEAAVLGVIMDHFVAGCR